MPLPIAFVRFMRGLLLGLGQGLSEGRKTAAEQGESQTGDNEAP